ncbi:MAG: hypothetical protein EHM20_04555 [Alphaproteobacteria bacterium]|nr:MAG: hypothetical protein EHM20_04555 [Alphaproteobacteria bacterium]
MKVPRAWTQDETFTNMLPYFLSRFVIDYHDEGTEWQICTMNSCELRGDGIEDFKKTLTPTEEGAGAQL